MPSLPSASAIFGWCGGNTAPAGYRERALGIDARIGDLVAAQRDVAGDGEVLGDLRVLGAEPARRLVDHRRDQRLDLGPRAERNERFEQTVARMRDEQRVVVVLELGEH